MSVSRETKKFIDVIYLLCAQTFSDMHVCTGDYGPDFGHRAEKKKGRFPANSTRVQRPIAAGEELKPV